MASTDSDFFHKLVDDADPTPLPANDQLGPPLPAAVHTAVKQVQWASFGGFDDGPDPFADLVADDGFLGALDTSGASSDHAALPAEVTDQDFFGGSPGRHNATDGQPECSSSSGAADSTDLNYSETMYPGWKFDQATQQWYQVDTLGNAQQQQPHDASYLQNSALQTIAEEETTTAMVSSWPSNMLFYAEYPGWYFDTNTQQWHSLESYQQAVIQPGTASAVQNGTNHTPSATVDSRVAQHNSFINSYTHQSQWQPDAFANTMQPETVTDGSLTNSFYGFDRQPNAQSISSSTGHQVGFNAVQYHYKGFESSSLQSGYNSTDTQQSSYNTFKPSNAFQAGYKGFEPATCHQTGHKVFEQSSSNQGGFTAFQHSLGSQGKAFEPSTGHDAGYKGFVPSTGSQAGYKGSETSTVHQAAYNGFETSLVQQAGYMPSQPSSYQLGFETSANRGYADANGVVNAQGFISKESMYHSRKQANAYQQGHLSNSYLGTKNSMNFTQQQLLGANASHMQFGHSSHEGRSSAGRPPHALVSFGFGGKLVVMKENSSMATNFNSGNQVSQ
jgi:COPII coat assembly protein SEC16